MFSFCKHYFFQKFFCKEGAHCTSCYVAVGFFLVLQNRTIGFEIKSLQCWVFLTPVYLGKNNGKTLRQICWHTTE